MHANSFIRILSVLLIFFSTLSVQATEKPLVPLRVGVLEFGTVNWELTLIQTAELAKKRGIDLKVVPLASSDASTVALQGGAVDMIVSDWIWVTRQRAESNLYTFAPYSNAVGSVMVKTDSGIRQVSDLKDKNAGHCRRPLRQDMAAAACLCPAQAWCGSDSVHATKLRGATLIE